MTITGRDQFLHCLLLKIYKGVDSLLSGWSTSHDVCPLVPSTAAGLGPGFEGSSIVQVLTKVRAKMGFW